MADPAALSVFWLYTLMLLFAAGALAGLYWAVRSGAVANDEAPKFRMLEDDLPVASVSVLPEGGEIHGDVTR